MKRIKPILKKWFCLPPFATVSIAVPCFVFVILVLCYETQTHTAVSYVAYLLSAYALAITITGIVRAVRAIRANGRQKVNSLKLVQKIRSHPLGEKLLDNPAFRVMLSMHGSLAVNLMYAVTNGYFGIRHGSAWSISLAGYYLLLVIMRGTLIGYTHRAHAKQPNLAAEYRRYRMVGIMLLLMNQALAAMVVYMTYQNKGAVYSGLMIYWMATYTFYSTISAIVSAIQYRKKHSPVLSAAKTISLTASLVSMLSLETAMLTQFHDETEDPNFRRWMVGISGGAVCVFVLGVAIFMMVKSTRYLRKQKEASPYGIGKI